MGFFDDFNWSTWLLLFALVAMTLPLLLQFVLLYIWAPLDTYRKSTLPARGAPHQLDPTRLAPAVQQVIDSVSRRYAQVGFRCEGIFSYEGFDFDLKSVEVNYANPDAGEIAVLIVIAGPTAQSRTLGVRTQLADGRWISTAGWQVATVLPPDPNIDTVIATWIRDPLTLVEFHRRRVAAAGQPAVRQLPYDDEELTSYLERRFEDDCRRWVDVGYAKLNTHDGRLHYTLRGAYGSVLKLIRPWRTLRTRKFEQKARAAWRATGMDSYTVPAEPVADDSVETADEAASQTALEYRTSLRQGEMTEERRGPLLIVRMGNATMGQVLRRQWFNLATTALWVGLMAFGIRGLWKGMQVWNTLPPALQSVIEPPRLPKLFWIAVVLMLVDIWQIYRALMKVRGTTTLTIGPTGIEFNNAPGTPRDGRILREDVFSLLVFLAEAGIRRRVYRLVAVSNETQQKVALLDGPDKDALERVKTAVREALQLDCPAEKPAPLSA